MDKRQLSAKEILHDVRAGMSDSELIAKYHLSQARLKEIFKKMVEIKALSLPELNMREGIFGKIKDLQPKSSQQNQQADRAPMENAANEPPLLTAARNGQCTEVKKLINAPIDLEVRDADGATPLILAAKAGHKEIVEFLLDVGANYNAEDLDGKSAVSLAAINNHPEIVGVLLRHQIQQEEKKIQEKPQENPLIAESPSGKLQEVTVPTAENEDKSHADSDLQHGTSRKRAFLVVIPIIAVLFLVAWFVWISPWR